MVSCDGRDRHGFFRCRRLLSLGPAETASGGSPCRHIPHQSGAAAKAEELWRSPWRHLFAGCGLELRGCGGEDDGGMGAFGAALSVGAEVGLAALHHRGQRVEAAVCRGREGRGGDASTRLRRLPRPAGRVWRWVGRIGPAAATQPKSSRAAALDPPGAARKTSLAVVERIHRESPTPSPPQRTRSKAKNLLALRSAAPTTAIPRGGVSQTHPLTPPPTPFKINLNTYKEMQGAGMRVFRC